MDKKDLKDKVLGNYLGQEGNDFPLDCETFDYIQNNNFITEILGNIAGDKCFIYGCKFDGTNYEPGYAFLRTPEHPEGEILPFEGGPLDSGELCIKSQAVRVEANSKRYETAYTKRSLSFSETAYGSKIIADVYDFTYASYNKPLYGEIKIWSGPLDKIPPGYHICDGSQFIIGQYPNLYKVIGTMYNNQHIGIKTTYNPKDYYQTDPGYFRIPDLRARFVVGCDETGRIFGDDDVTQGGYVFGSQGGLSTCKLTDKQSGLPTHDHPPATFATSGVGDHRHWAAADSNAANITSYNLGTYAHLGGKYSGTGDGAGGVRETSPAGNHGHSVTVHAVHCNPEVAKESHENKPPFMVLYYIIRCC